MLELLKDEVRFNRAKELLNRSDKQLKQIALESGRQRAKSFGRAFKLRAGVSPHAFRTSGK